MTHTNKFDLIKWLNENKATNEIKAIAGGSPLEQFKQAIYKLVEKDFGVEEREEIKRRIEPLTKVLEVEYTLQDFISELDEIDFEDGTIAYTVYVYRTMLFGDNRS